MSEYCVVVAEGARARFFTLEPAEVPELSGGPDLVEHDALANPQHRAHDDSIYANTRGGRYRTSGGQGHGYDEHRQRHASRLDNLARSNGTRRIILCAEKRMLGVLRGVVSAPPGTEIVEVGKDLAKLPTPELHRHLARDGHIPGRRPRTNGS